jgi:hypothetical protein
MMKITKLRDQLFAFGMKIGDVELVPIALNGFFAPYEAFVLVRRCLHLNIFGMVLSKRQSEKSNTLSTLGS